MRDSQSSTCTLGERRVAVAAVAPETCVATLVASAGDAELCAHTRVWRGSTRGRPYAKKDKRKIHVRTHTSLRTHTFKHTPSQKAATERGKKPD